MWTDYLKAFLVGGALCALGQVLIDRTKLTPARILTCYVVLGVVLHAVGVYAPLIEWAGAGASVPLTGFGSTLAKGVEKAVAEKGFLGAFTGGLTASAGGIAAAIFFGYLAAVLFKPKEKKCDSCAVSSRRTVLPDASDASVSSVPSSVSVTRSMTAAQPYPDGGRDSCK